MLSIQLVLSLAREFCNIWVKGRRPTTNGQRTDYPLVGIRDQNSPSEKIQKIHQSCVCSTAQNFLTKQKTKTKKQ